MMDILYTVLRISGDYAILRTAEGIENQVALALLPPEVDEGMRLLYRDFAYTVLA